MVNKCVKTPDTVECIKKTKENERRKCYINKLRPNSDGVESPTSLNQ